MTAHGRVPFVCGNWKLNHNLETTRLQLRALVAAAGELKGRVDIAVAPVVTCLAVAVEVSRGLVPIAAQNVHFADKGAFTGEWSVAHLKELGVTYAIIGHSERRTMFAETDDLVGKKVRATLDGGLLPIACIGETLQQREGGTTKQVIATQTEAILKVIKADEATRLTIAYEPVWAIGTGKTASSAQAQEVHAQIRSLLQQHLGDAAAQKVRLQYGGSVKADNAAELIGQPDVDGALVGGASLEAASLLAIAQAAANR
ncbi:MAG TPA: triose-phosphate isomerase [Myxococcota bacterium]